MAATLDAILFDLDDTICEYSRGCGAILADAFDDVGLDDPFTEQEYREVYPTYVDETDGVDELRTACFSHLLDANGYDPSHGAEIAQAYRRARDPDNVEFLPGAREAIEAVTDHDLGVVTNGHPELQSRKLDGLGITDHFEVVVHAGYDAPAKPAAEPFHQALDVLGAEPPRAIHVGNKLESDVAGAHAAGLQSAWLAHEPVNDPEPVPHYTLSSMTEFGARPWEDGTATLD
jgi:putative hydrolase of the HAD superfamily